MDTINTEAKRKIGPFEMSTDARILFNTLERLLIKGDQDFVSYQELSRAISRDVQREANGLLATARKNIEEQYKILLETVRNEGIKKSEDREGAADEALIHIKRHSRKRSRRIVRTINGEQMNATLAAKLGQLGAVELLSGPKVPKKLIEYVENKELKELSTAETLKLFSNEA